MAVKIIVLFSIIVILIVVLLMTSINTMLGEQLFNKFNGSDTASNETMTTIKNRAWGAISFSSVVFPLAASLAFAGYLFIVSHEGED